MPSTNEDCIHGGFLFFRYIFTIFNILLFVNYIHLCISVISVKKIHFHLDGGKQSKGRCFPSCNLHLTQ